MAKKQVNSASNFAILHLSFEIILTITARKRLSRNKDFRIKVFGYSVITRSALISSPNLIPGFSDESGQLVLGFIGRQGNPRLQSHVPNTL